ncbi:MAG: hypothetical protein CL949_09945 [Erythrobacter sp.]|nr:hypothetical protein [Erythrobacter sp.]
MTDNQSAVEKYLEKARGGYSHIEVSAAFNLVKDQADWKNPIDQIVPITERDILSYAIPYFTGTSAEFEDVEDPLKIRCKAPGYYAGPCN